MQFRLGYVVLASALVMASLASRAFAQDADETKITLRVVTPQEYEAEVKKHKGKVVLVDFWATWCIPCLKNFHHSVEWQKKYAKSGLVVISVSMDDSDADTKEQALEFLKKQKAGTITNLQSSLGRRGRGHESLRHHRRRDSVL
jgi:thiol:disulfide interchange protein